MIPGALSNTVKPDLEANDDSGSEELVTDKTKIKRNVLSINGKSVVKFKDGYIESDRVESGDVKKEYLDLLNYEASKGTKSNKLANFRFSLDTTHVDE